MTEYHQCKKSKCNGNIPEYKDMGKIKYKKFNPAAYHKLLREGLTIFEVHLKSVNAVFNF